MDLEPPVFEVFLLRLARGRLQLFTLMKLMQLDVKDLKVQIQAWEVRKKKYNSFDFTGFVKVSTVSNNSYRF